MPCPGSQVCFIHWLRHACPSRQRWWNNEVVLSTEARKGVPVFEMKCNSCVRMFPQKPRQTPPSQSIHGNAVRVVNGVGCQTSICPPLTLTVISSTRTDDCLPNIPVDRVNVGAPRFCGENLIEPNHLGVALLGMWACLVNQSLQMRDFDDRTSADRTHVLLLLLSSNLLTARETSNIGEHNTTFRSY